VENKTAVIALGREPQGGRVVGADNFLVMHLESIILRGGGCSPRSAASLVVCSLAGGRSFPFRGPTFRTLMMHYFADRDLAYGLRGLDRRRRSFGGGA
jgi:hypothetical protein